MSQRTLLCLLILFLSGCGPARVTDWLKGSSPPLLAQDQEHEQVSPNGRAEIVTALERGRYQEAIELLRSAQEQGHSPELFSDAWPQALNGLLALAEQHRKNREYSDAGHLYQLGLRFFPENSPLAEAIVMDQPELRAQLEVCADQLLNLGLLADRQGELERAIAIWNKIGDFHPQHKASQQALATTRRQLQNLESLPASSKKSDRSSARF